MDLLFVFVLLALVATVIAMLLGLATLGGGGAAEKEFSTPLMWARVGLQGFAILLLFVALLLR